jgi:hypothetical protein
MHYPLFTRRSANSHLVEEVGLSRMMHLREPSVFVEWQYAKACGDEDFRWGNVNTLIRVKYSRPLAQLILPFSGK